ncbi:MAG: hypothetical protein U0401_34550 [Anaerolineae bacterium]
MPTLKSYFYANIYLFLPGALILLQWPLLYNFFGTTLYHFRLNLFSSCDFWAGSGSINLCNNAIDMWSLLGVVIVSHLVALLVTVVILKRLQIYWRSPFYGLLLFYGLPALFVVIHLILNGLFPDTPRMQIGQNLINFGGPLAVLVLFVVSLLNRKAYLEQSSASSGQTEQPPYA